MLNDYDPEGRLRPVAAYAYHWHPRAEPARTCTSREFVEYGEAVEEFHRLHARGEHVAGSLVFDRLGPVRAW